MLASARFPRENLGTREKPAEWLAFVWAVNDELPGTFGTPVHVADSPSPGYETERYPHARIIRGPEDEGIRIVADSNPDVARAFIAAARVLGIHIHTDPSLDGPVRERPWFEVGDRVVGRGWENSAYARAGLNQIGKVVETKPIEGSNPLRQQFRAEGADWCGAGSVWNHSDSFEMAPE